MNADTKFSFTSGSVSWSLRKVFKSLFFVLAEMCEPIIIKQETTVAFYFHILLLTLLMLLYTHKWGQTHFSVDLFDDPG